MPQPANLNVASETMVRNRPPGDQSEARGSMVGHHCGGGEFESRRPKGSDVQRALGALGRRQRPRLVHQIGKPNAAPPRPRILLCRYHKPRGGVENLGVHKGSINRLDGKCERQIDFPLFERAIVPPGRQAADDARVG